MTLDLHILHLEDDPTDADIVREALETEGITCNVTCVDTEADFFAAVENGGFDLILADYTLPDFDGLSALKIARKTCPGIPFIFVSGTLDEEVAIDALKVGATDYVFKTRLSRIAPSVHRALREAKDKTERQRAGEALRRSEVYLAEAQRLSHTGSFGWNVYTGEIYWSQETFRIFEYDAGTPITREHVVQRTHPEDRLLVGQLIDQASKERRGFDFEHRLLVPDGSVKYVRVVGHPSQDESGNLEFVGAVTDITERKRADKRAEEERERLRQAHAELAYVNRLTMMGELTASLAHELKQPIAAAVTDARTCIRWLTRDHPDLEEAREAAMRMVKDATRAAEIFSRVGLLFKKGTPEQELVDLNEVIREMIVLLLGEAIRYNISVLAELAADLPPVLGDRVQLQQVFMNLMLNGIDAMKDRDGTRELTIRSQRSANEHLMISVSDTGTGVPLQQVDQIFNAFFTTKAHGTGMGLRISRSIVEAHGGRLWVGDNSSCGASFHLTLPIKVETRE